MLTVCLFILEYVVSDVGSCLHDYIVLQEILHVTTSGLVAEYIVAIDVTRVRFSAGALVKILIVRILTVRRKGGGVVADDHSFWIKTTVFGS